MSEINTIMQRMGTPVDISGDDNGYNEMRRDEILADLNDLTHYAVQGNHVYIRTNKGRCLLEKRDVHNAPMVGFVYKEHNKTDCVSFWFNASSVEHLGQLLRNNTKKRVAMERLLVE